MAVLLIAFHVGPPIAAQVEQKDGLTAEEKTRLAAGELVVRPSRRQQGKLRLIGGTSWQVIDAQPNKVWQTLLDTSSYPHVLPRVVSARVVEARTHERLVHIEHRAGPVGASYYLRVKSAPTKGDIQFVLDGSRPHTIPAAWGFYAVRPFGDNQTLLAYGVMADIGSGIFTGLVRDSVQRTMLKVPAMVKRHVEDGSGDPS